jgi:hypothetical protein
VPVHFAFTEQTHQAMGFTRSVDQLSPSESWTFGARSREQALALSKFPRGFLSPADSFALLPHSFLRRLFIGSPSLNFTEETFALELLLQDPQGLFNIIVANENFQSGTPFKRQGLD